MDELGDKDYEIVVPTRTDSSGKPYADNVPHYRRRRSLAETEKWEERTSYLIKAFGKEFNLELTAFSDFLSPNFVIEQIENNVTWIFKPEELPEGNLSHCFYKGIVDSKQDSAVAVSLCHGLVCI